MAEIVAKILSYGDLHLSSKDYGAHRNYPKDTLDILNKIVQICEDEHVTHVIGLGDFTFGRFNKLEYRESVEIALQKLNEITGNNHYQLKGNHDSASYGMTEFEYYISRGIMKPSENLTFGNVNISMVDYGGLGKTQLNIGNCECINIAYIHDFVKFKDTLIADYGKAIYLDEFDSLFGIDHIIAGHIHNNETFAGLIVKNINGQPYGHRATVDYLGAMSRPAYREGHTDEIGHINIITIYDNGEYAYEDKEIPLPSLAETFNLDAKEIEKEKKEAKQKRVDISDVVSRLNNHERNIGNPEDIIMDMVGIDDKYKLKAIEYLKAGQA